MGKYEFPDVEIEKGKFAKRNGLITDAGVEIRITDGVAEVDEDNAFAVEVAKRYGGQPTTTKITKTEPAKDEAEVTAKKGGK